MNANNNDNLALQEALVFYYEDFEEQTKLYNFLASSKREIFNLVRFRKNYKHATVLLSCLTYKRRKTSFLSLDYYAGKNYVYNINALRYSRLYKDDH